MKTIISVILVTVSILFVTAAGATPPAKLHKFEWRVGGSWDDLTNPDPAICKDPTPNCDGSWDCDQYIIDQSLEDVEAIKVTIRDYQGDPLYEIDAAYWDLDNDRDGDYLAYVPCDGSGGCTYCDIDDDSTDCWWEFEYARDKFQYTMYEIGDFNDWDYDSSDNIARFYWEVDSSPKYYIELQTGSCCGSVPC